MCAFFYYYRVLIFEKMYCVVMSEWYTIASHVVLNKECYFVHLLYSLATTYYSTT